jgi:nucleoside-diphosphate-sugar epimerase
MPQIAGKKVMVTGGIGMVGKEVVRSLLANGCQVKLIDRLPAPPSGEQAVPEIDSGAAAYASCDVNDFTALREQVRGCDSIIHLAALPQPSMGTPEVVFKINVEGTFNVFQAAAEEGIQRVVQASSINAVGLYYGVKEVDPLYFPIDEDHPPFTTDAYSFSKQMVEEIGRYFWRREGISSVSLRLPGVLPAAFYEHWQERRFNPKELIDRLLGMPEDERTAWLEDKYEAFRTVRRERQMETPEYWQNLWSNMSPQDRENRMVTASKWNFWAMIDERDSAQAFVKGLGADYEGSHALYINDRANIMGVESETILRIFFPGVTQRKRPLVGSEAIVSIDRARALIGFEPEYSFASLI